MLAFLDTPACVRDCVLFCFDEGGPPRQSHRLATCSRPRAASSKAHLPPARRVLRRSARINITASAPCRHGSLTHGGESGRRQAGGRRPSGVPRRGRADSRRDDGPQLPPSSSCTPPDVLSAPEAPTPSLHTDR